MASVRSGNASVTPLSAALPMSEKTPENPSWQRQLADAVRTPRELRNILGLADQSTTADDDSAAFPMLVPRSFVDRMRPKDPADPLLLQVLPTTDETVAVHGFTSDPVGDAAARRAPGMLQKYAGRALLITTGACAVHCRYCFRREYPYVDEPRQLDAWKPALDEIADDPTITEVILSGGDPLMLNDTRLRLLCEQLDAISTVERIRFHTRLPIVLPARVSAELTKLLSSLRAQPIVVIHANHGNEIAGDCADALRRLVRCGIPVLNQAVLLKGINDSVEALEELCRKTMNVGVMPYYLHQLDRVTGAAHFEVDADTGRRLIDALRSRLPGYAVPRYVQEIAGELSKTPLS